MRLTTLSFVSNTFWLYWEYAVLSPFHWPSLESSLTSLACKQTPNRQARNERKTSSYAPVGRTLEKVSEEGLQTSSERRKGSSASLTSLAYSRSSQTMKRRNPSDRWEPSRVPYRSQKELLSLACFRVVLLFSLVSRNSFWIPWNWDFRVEWIHATPVFWASSLHLSFLLTFPSIWNAIFRCFCGLTKSNRFARFWPMWNVTFWKKIAL